jgi:tape measure domain-containing protein
VRASTFTTYINAVEAANGAAAFDRMAARAVSAYANITRAADQASDATNAVLAGRGSGGVGAQVNAALRTRVAETRNVGVASEVAASRTNALARATRAEGEEAAIAARKNSALAASLRATAIGLNVVQGPLGPLAGRVGAIANAFEQLTGIGLSVVGIGTAVVGLGRVASGYQEVASSLRPFYDTQKQANAAMDDVVRIALRSRTALAPLATLYTRLTSASEAFGIDQSRVSRVVELASKAATLSGGSAESRKAGLEQFAQAVGSGNFAGDELKSVKENASQLAIAIANGFKNADGSIGTTIDKLRELGSQGKLTTNEILDALERSGAGIEDKFAKLPATLNSSLTKLSTAFTVTIGGFDQAVGLTSNLAQLLSLVADNMRAVTTLAVGFGAAFAIRKGAGVAKEFGDYVAGAVQAANAEKALLAAQLARADAAKVATASIVAGLTAERADIRKETAELTRLRQLQAAEVQRLTPLATTGTASRQRLYQTELKVATDALARSNQALAVTESKLRSNKETLAVATGAATASTKNFTVATENAAKRVGLLQRAGSGLLGLFGGPWGAILTVATGLLYAYATSASSAERATAGLTAENLKLYESFLKVAEARKIDSKLALNTEVQKFRNTAADGLSAERSARERFAFSIYAQSKRGGLDQATRTALEKLSSQAGAGADRERVFAEFQKIRNRSSALRASPNFIARAFGASGTEVDDAFKEISNAQYRNKLIAQQGRALIESQRQLDAPTRPSASASVSSPNVARLRAQALVDATDKGTNSIAAASARRKAALLDLDNQFGVKGGNIADPSKAAEYQAAATQIERTYRSEVDGIRSAASARRSAGAEARKDASEARRAAREAEQDRIREAKDAAQSRLDAASTALEDRRPGLSQQEYLDARVAILKTYDDEYNAIDSNDRLSRKAADQIESDARRRGAVISAITRDIERQAEINSLLLQGREAEARAVERTLRIVDEIGNAGYGQYQQLLADERQQLKINDALASRQRIVGSITDVLDATRSGFTQFLVDLPERGASAAGDYLKNIDRALRRAAATQLTEKIFAGADGKLRALLQGTGGIESRTAFLAEQMDTAGTASGTLATALTEATKVINEAATNLASGPASGGGLPAASLSDAEFARRGVANLTAQYIRDNPNGPPAANDNADIVVTALLGKNADKKSGGIENQKKPIVTTMPPSVFSLFSSMIGDAVGGNVGKFIKKNGADVIEGIYTGRALGRLVGGDKGEAIGGVLGGAASLTKALSSGSGAIASAASKASPYIAAVVAGFEIGTSIGKLLAPKPRANAVITSVYDKAVTYGNNQTAVDNVKQTVDSVQSTLSKVIDALGGTAGAFRVSIGQYKDYFRVSANGSDAGAKRAPNTASSQIIYDGKDASEATRIAVLNAIQDGAVQGIREGAQRLLAAGRDLEAQVNKALKFQNVFDRLKQKTDPVGFAVEKLNKEFTSLIAIFKEAGASNQEYADLTKLYELERADAIKQATNAASQALDQFLKDMVGSSSSPLNKRDTYTNAGTALDAFRADIAAGKTVDQNDLISAARNFQDSSRALNGSSQAFFDDFNALRDLLTKARDNAGITNVTNLPGSPLSSDPSVQAAIAALQGMSVAATQDQTAQLLAGLSGVEAAIKALNLSGYGGFGGGSSLGGLPGFNNNYAAA